MRTDVLGSLVIRLRGVLEETLVQDADLLAGGRGGAAALRDCGLSDTHDVGFRESFVVLWWG